MPNVPPQLAAAPFSGRLAHVRYAINEKLVTFRVLDDGAVLVNHDTGHYDTSNATGTFLWELLARGERTRAEPITALSHELEQDEFAVAGDVKHVLDELTRAQLLIVHR